MDLISAATLLFLVMDPLGNIPIFLSVLDKVPEDRRRRVLIRELLLALVVLVAFLFFGQYLLGFLGLSEHAIRIAGGIILFLIALKMVFPVQRSAQAPDEDDEEPFLVPLAIPLVAGPSAMAILMLLATNDPGRMPHWLAALGIAWVLTAIILLSATGLERLLGKRGLIAMERLMGMVLIALAVQMLLEGVTAFVLASRAGGV
ncbi:MAG: YhgN family NAAT transporter [Xanthomonadales bacterium]|jgi:multiple antibiotic resistance protein|nr:YhgN family NAAT transporter [Xanthomonadales bacterium]